MTILTPGVITAKGRGSEEVQLKICMTKHDTVDYPTDVLKSPEKLHHTLVSQYFRFKESNCWRFIPGAPGTAGTQSTLDFLHSPPCLLRRSLHRPSSRQTSPSLGKLAQIQLGKELMWVFPQSVYYFFQAGSWLLYFLRLAIEMSWTMSGMYSVLFEQLLITKLPSGCM